jgi:hypothetical protein
MIKHSITIKSSDYKYPTTEERARVRAESRLLSPFGFEYNSEIKMLFEDNLPSEEVKRISDLYEWDMCLLNKLGKLSETNVLLRTSYQRGQVEQIEIEKAINDYLFDYYTEIYYFYFFSARDLIAQIINVFYKLKIQDKDVDFRKLVQNQDLLFINDILTDFHTATKKTNDIRNSFTHRFPSNYPDRRVNIINNNGRIAYGFGSETVITPKDLIENIIESHNRLADLIMKLKVEFGKEKMPCS